MAFNSPNQDDVMMEINITPLIDVMLVLLVMLIITIPPQLHALKMNMPTKSEQNNNKPTVIEISFDNEGRLFWAGTMISYEQVREKLSPYSRDTDQPEFHIRPQEKTKYKFLIKVMNEIQKSGFTKVAIVGNERFVQD